jgi:hypothetical protein
VAWVFVDDAISEDMRGTCTCIHLHAPEASGAPEDDIEGAKVKRVSPAPLPKHHRSNSLPRIKTYRYKTQYLHLEDLPSDSQWWAERQKQFPGVNLHDELEKAQEWHRADKVKNAKLYFRNWLSKAKPTRLVVVAPSIEEQLARLKAR